MLEPVHDNDPGFIVAWHSKRKHEAGKFNERIMSYGDAHREAEKLQQQHPENAYWAEHIPSEIVPH